MIVVDRSAIVAILMRDLGWERLDAALRDDAAIIDGPLRGEAIAILRRRGLADAEQAFDSFVLSSGIAYQKFSKRLTAAAQRVFLRHGAGVHPGGLDLWESLTLALARSLKAPLLYAGDRFDFTGVVRA